jgi:ferrous iron transport protein B
MSCSARLPIFLLLAGAFFPQRAGVALFAMYIIGVALAALMAIVFRKTLFNKEETPFVMELPPYRIPSVKTMLRDTWEKGVQYLRKIGTTILIGSIVIWALSYFGPDYRLQSTDNRVEMENSYLGQIGKAIQPALAPLGFDWKASVALVTGVTAKEIVVSTLGVLYSADEEDAASLSDKLLSATNEKGEPLYNGAVAISLMLFVLIYLPCIGTLATIKSETGSWWWAVFVAVYTIALAWVVSFIAYQSVIHNVWQEVIVGLILLFVAIYIISNIIRKFKNRNSDTPCSSCSASGCHGCPYSNS